MNYEQQLQRYKEFVKLRRKGYSYSEIAERYGVSRQMVEYRLRKGKPKSLLSKYKGRDHVRMKVRMRDNFTCQDCSAIRKPENNQTKRLFDVHHLNGLCGKKSRSYDMVNDMDKLVTLCHKCHFNRHDHSQYGKKPTQKQRIKDIIKVYQQKKWNMAEIAEIYGISRQRVHQICQRQ